MEVEKATTPEFSSRWEEESLSSGNASDGRANQLNELPSSFEGRFPSSRLGKDRLQKAAWFDVLAVLCLGSDQFPDCQLTELAGSIEGLWG